MPRPSIDPNEMKLDRVEDLLSPVQLKELRDDLIKMARQRRRATDEARGIHLA